ncbi:transposable element Tcb1 transposase [Trichonephila clavipes]|nr:transposable element Tcb1 transposase [Trichonephila clavipes]
MNCLTVCQTVHWPARSPDLSPIEHVYDMMGRRLHLTESVHDLARQLEKICQEIPQETTRVLYHSIARRVTACIQTKATRGLLATDLVILQHGQIKGTKSELAPPLLTTTPHQREDVSALDKFNVYRRY